jgi:hypothetical protein
MSAAYIVEHPPRRITTSARKHEREYLGNSPSGSPKPFRHRYNVRRFKFALSAPGTRKANDARDLWRFNKTGLTVRGHAVQDGTSHTRKEGSPSFSSNLFSSNTLQEIGDKCGWGIRKSKGSKRGTKIAQSNNYLRISVQFCQYVSWRQRLISDAERSSAGKA